jgi:hypothetical protein
MGYEDEVIGEAVSWLIIVPNNGDMLNSRWAYRRRTKWGRHF